MGRLFTTRNLPCPSLCVPTPPFNSAVRKYHEHIDPHNDSRILDKQPRGKRVRKFQERQCPSRHLNPRLSHRCQKPEYRQTTMPYISDGASRPPSSRSPSSSLDIPPTLSLFSLWLIARPRALRMVMLDQRSRQRCT